MNEQEAIEGVQNRLDGWKNELEFLIGFGKTSPSRLKDCERQIEELAIVLESAKYLHEELINKECTEHFSTQKVLYLNTDLEESKVISNGQSKKNRYQRRSRRMSIGHQYELENDGHVTEHESIVCPYCFDERETNWDDTEDAPYESMEYECEKCGKYFEVACEPDTTFYYTSKRVSKVEGEDE